MIVVPCLECGVGAGGEECPCLLVIPVLNEPKATHATPTLPWHNTQTTAGLPVTGPWGPDEIDCWAAY
jgi:hypothetical protein